MALDDDTLRAMLAAATPGEWAPYCDEGPIRYRYLAPDGAGWTYSVCVGGYDSDHTCVLTATGPDEDTAHANAQLAASAPALAAEVLRLRDQAIVDHAAFDRLYAELDRLRAEAAARRHALCDALGLDAHTREYGGDAEVDAAIAALRERAARADSDAAGYLADHAAALLDLGAIRDAARAHLAADDALTIARRTDAADVPTAEARADAARECLAGLVGYVGEVAL